MGIISAAELAAASGATPYDCLPIAQAREQQKRAYARQTAIDLHQVRDLSLPGPAGTLPVRVHRPTREECVLPM